MTPNTDRLHTLSRVPAVRGNMCVDGCLHCIESQFLDYLCGFGCVPWQCERLDFYTGRSSSGCPLDALWMQRLMVFVDQLNDKFSARYWRSAYYYNNPISSRAWRRACESLRNSEMESITFKRGIVGSEGPY